MSTPMQFAVRPRPGRMARGVRRHKSFIVQEGGVVRGDQSVLVVSCFAVEGTIEPIAAGAVNEGNHPRKAAIGDPVLQPVSEARGYCHAEVTTKVYCFVALLS